MKTSRFFCALVFLLLLTGCIEFSRQTLSYRHDTAADTLFIFQDYQGIFGSDNAGQLESSESEQLASVMQGGRTFFFNNWITEYNRATLEEALKKPPGEIDPNPEYEKTVRELATLALANVTVENVGFYQDKEGKLCGAQKVTIRQCSKIATALNRLMLNIVREEAKDQDAESMKRLFLKFADDGVKFIQFDGNRVEVRWPMNEEGFREFSASPQGKGFRDSGGSFKFQDGALVITVGERDAKTASLTLPFSETAYVPNALAEAKRYGLKESFDARSAAAEFLAGKPPEK